MDRRPQEQSLKYLGPPVDRRGVVRKKALDLRAATGLDQLPDLTFFSPALPYLFGGFREIYWSEWMRDLGHDVELFYYKFEQPVFEGLKSRTQDPAWNYGLMACWTVDWDALVNFFCGLTITNRQTREATRYGVQELRILDPLAMDRRKVFVGDQKRTTLNVFGLYGNLGVAYFEQPTPDARPKLAFKPPDPKMVRFADAYFKEHNPLNASEPQGTPDGSPPRSLP